MKKRKIFKTPEERSAWEMAHETRMGELLGHIARIEAELTGKLGEPRTAMKPKEWTAETQAAWETGREARTVNLHRRINRIKAELATQAF